MTDTTSIYRISWSTPSPLGLARADISAIAGQVAGKLGYWPGEALDDVLSGLGGKLSPASNDLFDRPSLEVRPSGFVITPSMTTSLLRDRMDVAEDIGHYILHVLYQNQHRGAGITHLRAMRYGSEGSEKEAKREAIWFATAFLMPAADFREAWATKRGNALLLSERFKVPEAYVRSRAVSLGLAA